MSTAGPRLPPVGTPHLVVSSGNLAKQDIINDIIKNMVNILPMLSVKNIFGN